MYNSFAPYNPQFPNYGNQYDMRYNSFQQQMPMQKNEIIRVNGENGARMFTMQPNSSVLLLDENDPIVWFVQTDGAGYKTVSAYSIMPYQQPASVDTKSLEERIKRLEDIIDAKSNTGCDEQK